MLKQLAEAAMLHSGALRAVQRMNRAGVRILMYHRFPEAHRANFERQCELLAARYRVVPLGEAARRVAARETVDDLLVITVDDGYADMHEVALPILRRHGLPATLFVTTGFIDGTCWMAGDRVRHLFAGATQPFLEAADHEGVVHRFATRGGGGADALRTLLKRVPNQARGRMLAELDGGTAHLGPGPIPEAYRPCTWDQVRALAEAGISIGAHTVTHPILSRVETGDEIEREIVESKACLQRELERPVELFAYPNGTPVDLDARSVRSVRAHFKAAVTTTYGMNEPGADPHLLRRLPCDPDMPVAQLARMLAGPLRRGTPLSPEPAELERAEAGVSEAR